MRVSNRLFFRYLWLILLASAFLRLSAIGWGVPWFLAERAFEAPKSCHLPATWAAYHPDEFTAVDHVLRFPGNIIRNENLQYTTFIPTLCVTAFPLNGLVALSAKVWPSVFQELYFQQFGRMVNVFLGLCTAYLLAMYARRYFGDMVAIYATALLCLSPLASQNSAFFTLDAGVALLALVAVVAARQLIYCRSFTSYALAGIAAGMAMGAKPSGLFVLIAALGFHVMSCRRFGCPMIGSNVVVFVVATVGMFVLASPASVFSVKSFLLEMLNERAWLSKVASGSPTYVSLGMLAVQHATLLSPLTAILSAAGAIRCTIKKNYEELPVIFMIVFSILLIFPVVGERHLIIFSAFDALYAAVMVEVLCISSVYLFRAVGWTFVGAACAHGLFLNLDASFRRQIDPRESARRFIEDTVTPGQSVALLWSDHSWRYPFVDPCLFRRVGLVSSADFIVLSEVDLRNVFHHNDDFVWLVERDGKAVDLEATRHLVPVLRCLTGETQCPEGFQNFSEVARFKTDGWLTKRHQLWRRATEAGSALEAVRILISHVIDLAHFRAIEFAPPEIRVFRKMDGG